MALRNRKQQESVSKSASMISKINRRNQEQVKPKINIMPSKNEELRKKLSENSNNFLSKVRSKSVSSNNKKFTDFKNSKNSIEKKTLKHLITNSVKSSSVKAIEPISVNILRSKPITKSVSNTGCRANTLFHPSKINCASTPIKSVIKNESEYAAAEEMLFFHDTPIKGHKLKHMPKSSSQIAELAEKYFEKTTCQNRNLNDKNQINYNSINSYNDNLNSKIYYKMNEMGDKGNMANYSTNEKMNDDDSESGVESDELNKSFESKTKMKNEQRIQDIYTVSPTPEIDKAELTANEERLNLLRKKQREMLNEKKFLPSGTVDESFQNDLSESSSISLKKYSETSEHLKNALDSQNQLRTYIKNLESKLTNLRNEIKEAGNDNPVVIRKNSTESTDSLKEEKISSFNKNVYSEFLEKKKHLEKQKENFENLNFRRNSKLNDTTDDLEKKFIDIQINKFQSSPSKNEKQNDTLFSDNDVLEKSMYKGSSLFTKSFKSLETKFDTPIKKCEFSPIAQDKDKDKDPTITPRTHLLNPIPIRLSSSSSSFESSFSLKQALYKSETENLSPRLKSSKIWRVPSHESDKKNWSTITSQQVGLNGSERWEKIDKPNKYLNFNQY